MRLDTEAVLKPKLADVMEGGSHYKIPKTLLSKIHQHWHTVVSAFAGQNHTWQHAAGILDPLRYSDFDPQKGFSTFRKPLKPFYENEVVFYRDLK